MKQIRPLAGNGRRLRRAVVLGRIEVAQQTVRIPGLTVVGIANAEVERQARCRLPVVLREALIERSLDVGDRISRELAEAAVGVAGQEVGEALRLVRARVGVGRNIGRRLSRSPKLNAPCVPVVLFSSFW